MNNLLTLGWTEAFATQISETEQTCLARITTTGQNTYQGVTTKGTCQLKLTGKLSRMISEKYDLPAVGDWVVTDPDRQVIQRILQRQSSFVRNEAGNRDQRQVVAANINEIWLVMSLNHDLNLARLNRYVINAWDSGALPVIILTKADLAENLAQSLSQIQLEHPGIDVFACSSYEGDGLEQLKARLTNYRTIALVGSSGVGKSTLINHLADRQVQKTGGIRDGDDRGKHTTTSRNLIPVKEAWLVDTPGMRELGLWSSEEQLDQTFEDIALLTQGCRFNNCQHQTEPGCRITSALETGELTTDRLQQYQKLQRELAYLEKRTKENERIKQRRR